MEIDINQQAIAIGDKYKIFTDGQLTHTATRTLLQLLPEIKLFEHSYGARARMTINKTLSPIIEEYDIMRWDNNLLEFRRKSYWTSFCQCQCGPDTYDIYPHTGRKYSIYKNEIQVAWWDKQAVTWFAGDNYKIIADKDCDFNLIISFCLVVDNFSSSDHGSSITSYDFGTIVLFQAKKFDKNWQPKQ